METLKNRTPRCQNTKTHRMYNSEGWEGAALGMETLQDREGWQESRRKQVLGRRR